MYARRPLRPPAPLLAAVLVGVLVLGGCAGAPTDSVSSSKLSFDRTFDIAQAALTDQKLAISRQDRRAGILVGDAGNRVTITATLQPLPDGSTRVSFSQQPDGADPALLQRVAAAYDARMAQHGILGAFRGLGGSGSGSGSGSGPVPCPSGPAFCP
jgi:hypothetical protein